jgi:CheY-like chemotaxis protein
LLAGRKLLLADDSITIQKVVGLTFADEGVKVVSVGNGREAIERLEEIGPDIVLADVFMPEMSGYQVCEYIKQNEKLSHIPVMLLVGSFEPFDEAEARRVGADDTLTKPFQSIRRLIDKVGALVTGPLEVATPTAGPEQEMPTSEPRNLGSKEIELRTKDTEQLPLEERAEQLSTGQIKDQSQAERPQDVLVDKDLAVAETDRAVALLQRESTATSAGAGDVLLELGDPEQTHIVDGDEFVLDLGFDEVAETSIGEKSGASFAPAFAETEVSLARAAEWDVVNRGPAAPPVAPASFGAAPASGEFLEATVVEEYSSDLVRRLADTQEWLRTSGEGPAAAAAEPEALPEGPQSIEAVSTAGQIQHEQVSPEVIEAIARRVVEHLSEKIVQEIAWEVVPQLAELLIKRQLAEKESQTK